MSVVPPAGSPAAGPPPAPARERSAAGTALRVVVALLGFAFAQIFTGCLIPFPTNMADQVSFGYLEPPREEPPGEAVAFGEPHQVASLGTPANPVSYSEESQSRGQANYAVFCQLCHGEPGSGRPGGVGELFQQPAPPDLSESAARLSDGEIFQIITAGFGRMPALGGRMGPLERWDTVNYLRSFAPSEQPPAAGLQNAARNYSIQCSQCHGSSGEGALGTPLYPSSFLTEGSVEEIARFISVGRRQRGMPPFAGRMSQEEVVQLSSFLKDLQEEGPALLQRSLEQLQQTTTTGGPDTTAAQTTTTTAPQGTTTTAPAGATTTTGAGPALLEQGTRVFDANCQGCHGAEGAGGGIGPQLNPNGFVAQSPDEEVRGVIENGRPGTAMPPFEGRLSEDEIAAALALLRSWSPSEAGFTDVALAQEAEELPFSHRAHVQRGVQCTFCHSGATRGPSADLPSLELCAGCHRSLTTQNESTQRVVAAFDEGLSVSWPRVYKQPDFVYFSHRPHVAVAGLACSTCHGEVGEMTLARRVKDLSMGFCLDCHQQQDYVYAEEGEAQSTEGGPEEERPPTGRFLTDCHICHK